MIICIKHFLGKIKVQKIFLTFLQLNKIKSGKKHYIITIKYKNLMIQKQINIKIIFLDKLIIKIILIYLIRIFLKITIISKTIYGLKIMRKYILFFTMILTFIIFMKTIEELKLLILFILLFLSLSFLLL